MVSMFIRKTTVCMAITVFAFFLSCVDTPPNPYSAGNTTAHLVLKNSQRKVGLVSVEDSVGKQLAIGVYRYLPNNFDSVRIEVSSPTSTEIRDTVLYTFSSPLTFDTLWQPITFPSAGTFSVVVSAFGSIAIAGKIFSDSATIIIHGRPIPDTSNHPPIDSMPSDPSFDHQKPKLRLITPGKDSGSVNSASIMIAVTAKDESGITSVICSIGDSLFAVQQSDSIYSAAITGLIANQYSKVRFIATDGSNNGNKETLFIVIKYDPTMTDNKKPTMIRKTPAKDSGVVSSASASVSVSVKAYDENGITSVTCSVGDSLFAVQRSDSIFSATITGFVANQFNKIRFIATDASSNGNKETLFVSLKYDPTILDNVAPAITKTNGPASGSIVATASVSYEFTVIDDSGVDSVFWGLNGARQSVMTATSGGKYTLNAVLNAPHANKIVVYAMDLSSNHNRDSLTLTLDYNRPPVAIAQTSLTTKREVALACTLKATDPESDPLSSWTLTAPGHGGISASRPNFVYTPQAGFEGKDTMRFTVSDGMAVSDTSLIIITVNANNIAPVIMTQPVSISVDQSKNATFSATINTDVYPQPNYIRWVHNNTDTVPGQTTLTCIIAGTQYKDSGNYKVVVRNFANTTESDNNAKLTIRDKTPPLIHLSGDSEIIIMVNGSWNDPGATANDDKDGPLSVTSISVPQFSINKIGKYIFTYSAADAAGNGTKITRIVHVEGWTPIGTISSADLSGMVVANDSVLYIGYIASGSPFGIGTIATYKNGTFQTIGATIAQTAELSLALSHDRNSVFFTTFDVNDSSNNLRRINGITNWTSISENNGAMSGYRVDLFIGKTDIFVAENSVAFEYRSGIKKLSGSLWDSVTVNEDNQLCESSRNSMQKMSCVTDNGAIYSLSCHGDYPICNKYSNGKWSPGAGSDSIIAYEGISSEIANHQILSKGNDVYAGVTLSNGQSNPTIWRLRNGIWTKLRSMAQDVNGRGNGFCMTFSSDGTLYAAKAEGNSGNSITVRSYNETMGYWENVPTIGPSTAFQAGCDQVTIAAGRNVCYVAIQSGSEITVWQWKRQI
jgi:hypothetical protein